MAFLAIGYQENGIAAEKGLSEKPFDLTVGLSPRSFVEVDTEDIRVIVKTLMKVLLGKVWAGSHNILIYQEQSSMERDILARKVEIAMFLPDEFLGVKNRVPIEPVAIATRYKGIHDEIVILVRKESGIRSSVDLMNKRINIPRGLQAPLFQMWMETLFMKEGVSDSRDFFAALKTVNIPSQAILPVFFKQADACIVLRGAFDLVGELNPQITRELEILYSSSGVPAGIIGLRRDLSVEQRDSMKKILWSVHEEPEGKQIFTLFRISKLLPFRPEYLRSLEALQVEHQNLKLKLARGK